MDDLTTRSKSLNRRNERHTPVLSNFSLSLGSELKLSNFAWKPDYPSSKGSRDASFLHGTATQIERTGKKDSWKKVAKGRS